MATDFVSSKCRFKVCLWVRMDFDVHVPIEQYWQFTHIQPSEITSFSRFCFWLSLVLTSNKLSLFTLFQWCTHKIIFVGERLNFYKILGIKWESVAHILLRFNMIQIFFNQNYRTRGKNTKHENNVQSMQYKIKQSKNKLFES